MGVRRTPPSQNVIMKTSQKRRDQAGSFFTPMPKKATIIHEDEVVVALSNTYNNSNNSNNSNS